MKPNPYRVGRLSPNLPFKDGSVVVERGHRVYPDLWEAAIKRCARLHDSRELFVCSYCLYEAAIADVFTNTTLASEHAEVDSDDFLPDLFREAQLLDSKGELPPGSHLARIALKVYGKSTYSLMKSVAYDVYRAIAMLARRDLP